MWRKNTFTGNQDSDQSISEEENVDGDWSEHCVSLCGSSVVKGGIQVLSQLELLKDACELKRVTEPTISDHKIRTDCCIEDEVEIPIFNNEGDFIRYPRMASMFNSDEETLPDDEVKENNMLPNRSSNLGTPNLQKVRLPNPSFGTAKKEGDGDGTWFAATREAEALAQLNENAWCSSSFDLSSKVNRSSKGSRGKGKPKFSFRCRSRKEDFSWASKSNDETDSSLKALPLFIEHKNKTQSMTELLEGFQEEKLERSEIHEVPADVAIGHHHAEHSMAELLDCFQEKNVRPQEEFKVPSRTKVRRARLVDGRSLSPLDRNMDEDDPLDALDSGLSSGDEENPQNLKLFVPEFEQKTIADKFQDALGAAPMDDGGAIFAFPIKLGYGIFGKLQQIMQIEKEREMGFLKRLQKEACSNDEASCIDVRILSRCLEAKLTVCSCSVGEDKVSPQRMDNPMARKETGGKTLKFIFSSKTCGDVNLEVGNLIRVYSPWKEVKVSGKEETIVLSTYFSQISI